MLLVGILKRRDEEWGLLAMNRRGLKWLSSLYFFLLNFQLTSGDLKCYTSTFY